MSSENDRALYGEILTADYIMANPMAAEAYGDDATKFVDESSESCTSSCRPRSQATTGRTTRKSL